MGVDILEMPTCACCGKLRCNRTELRIGDYASCRSNRCNGRAFGWVVGCTKETVTIRFSNGEEHHIGRAAHGLRRVG